MRRRQYSHTIPAEQGNGAHTRDRGRRHGIAATESFQDPPSTDPDAQKGPPRCSGGLRRGGVKGSSTKGNLGGPGLAGDRHSGGQFTHSGGKIVGKYFRFDVQGAIANSLASANSRHMAACSPASNQVFSVVPYDP
ncbi:MAG: hypothetical protein ACI9X4_000712 [Glaciecola sp.]|jgi:hypothetical protein